MRRYYPKKASAVLDEMSKEMPLLRRIFIERELAEIEEKAAEKAISDLGITFSISEDEHLLIHCPTPLALSYMRSRQGETKTTLSPLLERWELRGIKIILSDGKKSVGRKRK